MFPQLFGCGPIEAAQRASGCAHDRPVPQLFGCGPIEAWRTEHYTQNAKRFHSCLAVAPLKPVQPRGERSLDGLVSTAVWLWPH